ncbi:uncharacterized protein LOC134191483 [Corticium candelabrum]|uniref:uncharacterized protein LOC134191483 n=1 Tax=Corticium candelabrum TaxID=121492 RepID=UPI002E265416|nr:uncharacterized protein LOC134191483 [Corticium candelabrum]
MLGKTSLQGILIPVFIVLISFGFKGGEACDSSRCCCVDSATITQSGNVVTIQVRVFGSCPGSTTFSVTCIAYGNTLCFDNLLNPSLGIYKSGKIVYYGLDFDSDICDARLKCQSGSCATSSAGWAGEYTKTTDTATFRCDPKLCCCATSAVASASVSGVTLAITPTANATGCPNQGQNFNENCVILGDLYMACGDFVNSGNIDSSFLIKKKGDSDSTNYVFESNDVCNAVFECTSSGCMSGRDFVGQYRVDSTGGAAQSFSAMSKFVITAGLFLSTVWLPY